MDNIIELTPQPEDFDPTEIEALIEEVDNKPINLSLLVYGRSGVGKTRFGATGKRVLIINCNEQKPISIRGMGAKVINIKKVPEDTVKIFWYLRNGGYKKYDTVVIDSLSSLQKMYERFVVDEGVKKDASKSNVIVSQRDYGIVGNYMFVDVTNYRNLQEVMNVVFIALERVPSGEENDDIKRPDVMPSLQRVVESAVNIIGRMYLKEVKVKGKNRIVSTLYVGPHNEWMTKDCTGTLGKEILVPTLPKLLKKIEENYNKNKKEE